MLEVYLSFALCISSILSQIDCSVSLNGSDYNELWSEGCAVGVVQQRCGRGSLWAPSANIWAVARGGCYSSSALEMNSGQEVKQNVTLGSYTHVAPLQGVLSAQEALQLALSFIHKRFPQLSLVLVKQNDALLFDDLRLVQTAPPVFFWSLASQAVGTREPRWPGSRFSALGRRLCYTLTLNMLIPSVNSSPFGEDFCFGIDVVKSALQLCIHYLYSRCNSVSFHTHGWSPWRRWQTLHQGQLLMVVSIPALSSDAFLHWLLRKCSA